VASGYAADEGTADAEATAALNEAMPAERAALRVW